MKPTKQYMTLTIATMILIGCALLPASALSKEAIDHALFDELLKSHVNQGIVDYRGFKNHEKKLDNYLQALEQIDPDKLSRNERFAFYINAYNAWTIKLILTGYPGVKSIKDLGNFFKSPWKKKICRINGKVITLDDIEHSILRPEFKDPRVHFAVNCASKSCPPLRQEAYQGNKLDSQLNDATKKFLNNPKENYLDGENLYVSKIFKWFGGDFNDDIVEFFIQYAQEDLRKNILRNKDKIDVRFLDYDWSLNGK